MTNLELLKRDLLLEMRRCVDLFNSQALSNRSIFTQSVFIEIMIRLNYVLQKLSAKNHRLAWTDDINTNHNIKNITDLVNNLRNAACHSGSPENYINESSIKFVFNRAIGKAQNAFKIGENVSLGCEYEDDIAFYFGDKRIYLIRHIERLLKELPIEINKLR